MTHPELSSLTEQLVTPPLTLWNSSLFSRIAWLPSIFCWLKQKGQHNKNIHMKNDKMIGSGLSDYSSLDCFCLYVYYFYVSKKFHIPLYCEHFFQFHCIVVGGPKAPRPSSEIIQFNIIHNVHTIYSVRMITLIVSDWQFFSVYASLGLSYFRLVFHHVLQWVQLL